MAKVNKWNEILRQNEEFDELTVEDKEKIYKELEAKRKERIRNLPRFIFGALVFLPVYPLIFCVIGCLVLIDLCISITQPSTEFRFAPRYRDIVVDTWNASLFGNMNAVHALVVVCTLGANPLFWNIGGPGQRFCIGFIIGAIMLISHAAAEENRRFQEKKVIYEKERRRYG